MVKEAAVIPGLGESDVALEYLGYTEDEILRIKSARERARAIDLAKSLAGVQNEPGA